LSAYCDSKAKIIKSISSNIVGNYIQKNDFKFSITACKKIDDSLRINDSKFSFSTCTMVDDCLISNDSNFKG